MSGVLPARLALLAVSGAAFIALLPATALGQTSDGGALTVAVLPSGDSTHAAALDSGSRMLEARLTSSARFALLAEQSALQAMDNSREQAGVSPTDLREAQLEAARRGYADLAVEVSMTDAEPGAWLVSVVVYNPLDGVGIHADSELVAGAGSPEAAARLGLDALAQRIMTSEAIHRLEDGSSTNAGGRLDIRDITPVPVRVLVNGRERGLAPGQFVGLPTGTVEIELRADGYETLTRTADLSSGRVFELSGIALEPAQAQLDVRVNVDDATILIDGESVGASVANTWVTVSLPMTARHLRITRPGYQPWAGRANALNGDARLEVDLQRLDGPDGQDVTTADCSRTAAVDRLRTCLIPRGEAIMGTSDTAAPQDSRPEHTVHLTDAFSMHRTEVSVSAWQTCVDAGACVVPGASSQATGASARGHEDHRLCNYGGPGRTDHPMNCVNWQAAADYCAWSGGALPTEAQWERAARGTDARAWPWSLDPLGQAPSCDLARSAECELSDDGTAAVGEHPAGASPYGIQDLAGNVAEWVVDTYESQAYALLGDTDPVNDAAGSRRVVRGGSFRDLTEGLLPWARARLDARARVETVGFRCVYPAE
ncbi:MAG: SUMF1/EgtB/PvdO family nonheme iron enzyme [Myxococcales bacterium]|nr:SUMF1/EgtB/PvdO family nonheme iron enzyme [Myxococcales bacterium]